MTDPDRAPAPPPLARLLLRRVLDGPARSAIVGDLDEEFARFIVPQRGLRRARRWYWRQALASIVACAGAAAVAAREPDEPRPKIRDLMNDTYGLWTDVRAAVRFCGRSPLTSTAVILTLAIGVGANTAVFSIVNATFVKPLPVTNADRLVEIDDQDGGSFTYPEYLDSRGAAGLSALIAGGRTSTTMGEGHLRRRIVIDFVTANYFDALGTAAPAVGRLLTERDDAAGSAPVIVLSHSFWRSAFGSDRAIVGRTVKLQHAFFTIVGVAPDGFSGVYVGFSPDVWVPLTHGPEIEQNAAMLGPGSAWLGLLGILERRDSLPVARDALAARWRAYRAGADPALTPIPRGMMTWGQNRDLRLRILGVLVVLMLAIACLNVATLLAAGVHERQKELAIRVALGAGRARLLRQLLLEQLVLAAVGGAAGGVLGTSMSRMIAPMMAGEMTAGDLDVRADGTVVLFTVAVSGLVAVAVALLPALRWSKVNTLVTLQGGGSGMNRLLRSAGLWWLIPAQVALGTVLLASAGVLGKTVHQLKLGIESSAPDRVWFANLLVDTIGPGPQAFADFQARLRAHLQTMRGIEAAGMVTGRPLASVRRGPLRVEGMTVVPKTKPMPWGPPPPPPPRGAPPLEKMWIVSNNYVSPGLFASLALPIVRGRDFTDADTSGAPRVAIVNETLAAQAFGNANPIGRRVAWAPGTTFDIEIVGVVRDFRGEHLRQSAPDAIFFPLAQIPSAESGDRSVTGAAEPIDVTLVVRAVTPRAVNRERLMEHVVAFDPRLFVDRIWTFDEEAGRALSDERLLAATGSVLSVIALALLVVGVYGAFASAVVRGRREIGIRLALGASPHSV
ncbi:MAG TPA: ABC transporter permease, partial [Vicinamibacterales bacterium]|nr:ABC transporter permease [Vicinamibacterales bacterium]